MMTLDGVRAAILSAEPFAEMDRLVRSELGAGRTTGQLVDDLRPIIDDALDTPGLTDDGEEAFLSVLDALTENCRPDQWYSDPPDAPPTAEGTSGNRRPGRSTDVAAEGPR
jgi:hypothetical protein